MCTKSSPKSNNTPLKADEIPTKETSDTNDYFMFGMRVLVGVGLMTGIANNNRLIKEGAKDVAITKELGDKMDQITEEMSSAKWKKEVEKRVKSGEPDAVRNAVNELLKEEKEAVASE
eukprot:CAMPEP_0185037444 /NCGR_PEP_ID=MMETSP1103-20130426/31885_1 /TAXON_ID=36769 /ORGANISM="Paraphysomonas bandaiensis, Strain Caron Lab Isolate" /LENGTH=117 /DNA_ID=CAMNT_0027575423 /DNA_START=45 /DNA_END=398 /DNA_ORIENTATION=-